MSVTRRGFTLGLAAGALPARAQPIRRVLFIGNSFLRDHDVPQQIARRATAEGKPLDIHVIVRPGARLAGHWGGKIAMETVRWGWEVVVLQDHSLDGLIPERAQQSASAIRQFAGVLAGTAVVLVVPWSRKAGHQLFTRPGMPEDPAEMTERNTRHYASIAAETGAYIAPVATAWAGAIASGATLHGPDGYHANPEGAALTADVIWRTLDPLL
ncbi:MAG: hypothetical protein AAFU49_01125 [Pseudomonadota bacterium]